MKKLNLLFLICFYGLVFAQIQHEAGAYCGFDDVQKEMDKKFPETKERRLRMENEFRKHGISKVLKEYNINLNPNKSGKRTQATSSAYTGPIFEIPVVVHIVESSDPSNAHLKLTDAQVENWVENANKMYATTYGNGFYAEGDGIDGGNVIPFRLVLAKRTPDCKPTNGIIRYNGSTVAGYDEGGVRYSASYAGTVANTAEIRALTTRWPETSYYNIYIYIGFDGNKAGWETMGWATGPDARWSAYETVMKAAVVTKAHDSTLAHEFGHALGLAHTFHNVNSNGGVCPANNDCTTDNDRVCDTEPTQSLLNVYPTPTNNDTNPCTGQNYQGTQYNIMNYTYSKRKFTKGQRERALALFLSEKGALINSLGGTPPDATSSKSITLTPLKTHIAGTNNVNNQTAMGIKRLRLGNIDNFSDTYASGSNKFYTDYSIENTCLNHKTYTDLPVGKKATLTVDYNGINPHQFVIWIDFNNDGVLHNSAERFTINGSLSPKGNNSFSYEIPFDIIKNAVTNTYIRFRIRGDWYNTSDAYSNLTYGEVEDYAIRLVTEDFIDPATTSYPGRVGINTKYPQATLDVREVTPNNLPTGQSQGVSFPNFTTAERSTFTNVKIGTMIFNTTLKCLEIYTESGWKCFSN